MSAYSTHLKVLKQILKAGKIKTVLEFGPGQHSTPLFLDAGCKLVSIEQQNNAWVEVMAGAHAKAIEKRQLVLMLLMGAAPGPNWLEEQTDKFDLVLVDGHARSRAACVNAAFAKTGIVAAHDTEHAAYSWDLVKAPKGWKRIDFKESTPWTTVWVKSPELARKLKK